MLAQMQLQQQAEAAIAECTALRSQLEAQVAAAAEAQQQYAADLEACKENVSTAHSFTLLSCCILISWQVLTIMLDITLPSLSVWCCLIT